MINIHLIFKLRSSFMKPIQKTSIIDQVVDSLLEFIASDRVKIGDKMPPEQELCDLLKVGQCEKV